MTTRNTPANIPKATLTGSGTAVISRLQPFKVLVPPPPETSAKNNVHVPFGFRPAKVPSRVMEPPPALKLEYAAVGLVVCPSAFQAPLRKLSPAACIFPFAPVSLDRKSVEEG